MTADSAPTTTRGPGTSVLAFVAAVVVPAVVAVALCAVVAALAHGAGVSHDFQPLNVSTLAGFVVVGLLAGATGWSIVRARSAAPARVLARLVPTVVVVSFVPDLLVGIGGSMVGSSWGGVIALMVMHLIVAACGIVGYRVFLPLPRPADRPT